MVTQSQLLAAATETVKIFETDVPSASLYDGLFGAVIGGLIGGLASLGAAVLVLRRTLKADKQRADQDALERRELAAADRAADRAAARAAVGVAAAGRLLRILADLQRAWVEHQGQADTMRVLDGVLRVEPWSERVELTLERMLLADVPLLHDEAARRRLSTLVDLAAILGRALSGSAVASDDMTSQHFKALQGAQLQEFLAYEQYCRDTLTALIDERPLPAHEDPPDLRTPRTDGLRWRAPNLPPLPPV